MIKRAVEGLIFAVRKLVGILGQTSVPIWLTILLTVGGTYVLAPIINDNIQRENLRRDFLVNSLAALSTDTIALITLVHAHTRSEKMSETDDIVQAILNIQYRLVQLNIALPRNLEAGVHLQTTLTELQKSVTSPNPDRAQILESLSSFSTASFDLYGATVRSAGLI